MAGVTQAWQQTFIYFLGIPKGSFAAREQRIRGDCGKDLLVLPKCNGPFVSSFIVAPTLFHFGCGARMYLTSIFIKGGQYLVAIKIYALLKQNPKRWGIIIPLTDKRNLCWLFILFVGELV